MTKMQKFKALTLTLLNRMLIVFAEHTERRDKEQHRAEVYAQLLSLSPLDNYQRRIRKGQRLNNNTARQWPDISLQYAAAKALIDHDERYNKCQ